MHHFASGFQRNYYGKADVIVYRLRKPGGVFGASVTMLLYGDAFWPTYAAGDNTGLVATDSMKNFIQWETRNFTGADLETYCRFLAGKFLRTYPQTEGIQVEALEIPYDGAVALVPRGTERSMARIEITQEDVVEIRSGIYGFKLLKLGGSAFSGFVRDQYTTLPDVHDRPLHMWLDLEWICPEPITGRVREIVHQVFRTFESGSIQQVIYQIGVKMLADLPAVTEVRLEANNRTWDKVSEDEIYTEPRPPYGVLGLTLRR
ncbi:MAG: urate oxidase [Acidobacteriia bacterium]|nr:urate oxidase [Terriglobia bacterium]